MKNTYDYYNYTINANGDLRPHIGDYQTTNYADLTERLVPRLAARDRPFFLWQSHIAPHGACSTWPMLDGQKCWTPAVPSTRYYDTLEGVPQPQLDSPAYNERDVSDKPRYIWAVSTILDRCLGGWIGQAAAASWWSVRISAGVR